MKVFYVTMVFPATSETFACVDVRALKRLGVDVSVYAMRRPSAGWQKMLEDRGLSDLTPIHGGWRSFFIGFIHLLRNPLRSLIFLGWLFKQSVRHPMHLVKGLALMPRAMQIFFCVLKEQPDVVHLFWGHYPSLVGFLVQRFQPHIKLSVFLGAYDLLTGFAGSIFVAKRADVVWTHAGCNLSLIKDWDIPEEKIKVCHRGIDLMSVEKLEIRKVPRRVLTAGRLHKRKGVDWVLRIFKKTVCRWPDASLVILGSGPEEKRLKRLAGELEIQHAVRFGGHVSHAEVYREMAAAEVFILPTSQRSERLPNVVKEAMACGCICLVSPSPGIEELITHGETGFVLPFDEEAFVNRLDEIFRSQKSFAQMAHAAKLYINENFNASRQMARYCHVWEKLISQTTGNIGDS